MADQRMLEGKTALVTGGSRGIGLAIADRLGQMGAQVSICARDASRLKTAEDQLKRKGIRALGLHADVTLPGDVKLLVQETQASIGPIEILVNNAGTGYFGPVQDANEAAWDSVLDTNLKGVFLLTRAVAPGMIERRSGHIINIASLAGKNAFAGGAIYCASKWGLLGFTYSTAEDLRAYGIRVSAICPGSVATEFGPHSGKDVKKMLTAEDVAHAVEMLVAQSPQSFISEISMRPTQKP
ncbi:MAG TPA: SDR family NAD(P)-dependent oxidoreductase [Candidatus Acidoferrales bacterium]|nr:SDR family NAD(P)-dependent oxidoreductase [Candidatus Acidoferrales bacterium]